MPAVSTCAIDADRVLARVGGGGVEGDFSTLVAVLSIDGPRGLVPTVLKAFRDLCDGEGREGQGSEKGSLLEHDCSKVWIRRNALKTDGLGRRGLIFIQTMWTFVSFQGSAAVPQIQAQKLLMLNFASLKLSYLACPLVSSRRRMAFSYPSTMR